MFPYKLEFFFNVTAYLGEDAHFQRANHTKPNPEILSDNAYHYRQHFEAKECESILPQ